MNDDVQEEWPRLVQGLVERTRFGQVVITIHQGKVVQVEHTEKTRLERSAPADTERATAHRKIWPA